MIRAFNPSILTGVLFSFVTLSFEYIEDEIISRTGAKQVLGKVDVIVGGITNFVVWVLIMLFRLIGQSASFVEGPHPLR